MLRHRGRVEPSMPKLSVLRYIKILEAAYLPSKSKIEEQPSPTFTVPISVPQKNGTLGAPTHRSLQTSLGRVIWFASTIAKHRAPQPVNQSNPDLKQSQDLGQAITPINEISCIRFQECRAMAVHRVRPHGVIIQTH